MWTLLSAALAVPVTAAGHHGTYTGPDLVWESEVLMPLREGEGTLPLAVPLPAEVEVLDSPYGVVEAIRNEQGQITDLALSEFPPHTERAVIRVRQPFEEDSLYPPLIQGDALQRITLDGAFYEPSGEVGVYRHLNYLAQSDVTLRERRGLDRQLDGKRAKMDVQPMYLVADTRLTRAGGLHGTLRPVGERKGTVAWFVGLTFAALLGFCGIGYRVLARTAKRESVDAYIREEFKAATSGLSQPEPDASECGA